MDSRTHTANRNTGVLDMYTYLPGRRAGSIDLRTAVGFYFRPVTESGLLRIDTAPAYSMDINTYSAFGSSSTSAWLGMFIGEYTVSSGTYVGAKVSTKNTLGSLSTWWSGSSSASSSSGYSMSSTISVDNSHWYAIWVWGGIKGSVAEEGWLSNTGVISSLDMTVPSFIWTLY